MSTCFLCFFWWTKNCHISTHVQLVPLTFTLFHPDLWRWTTLNWAPSSSTYSHPVPVSSNMVPFTSTYLHLLPSCFTHIPTLYLDTSSHGSIHFHLLTLTSILFHPYPYTLPWYCPVPPVPTRFQPCPPSSNMVPFTSTYLHLLPSCFTHIPNTLPWYCPVPPSSTYSNLVPVTST